MGNATTAQLPYTDLEERGATRTGWRIYSATKRATGKPVTIFEKVLTPGEDPGLSLNFYKQSARLQHPYLLKASEVETSADGSKLLVVTEPARPLAEYIHELSSFPNAASFGLYQIAQGIAFLHKCNLVHGNVSMDTVFINAAGDWKLSGFDYVTDIESVRKRQGILLQQVPAMNHDIVPPELSNNAPLTKQSVHAIDTYMLGCFMHALFSGTGRSSQRSKLKDTNSIPHSLREEYVRMLKPNPRPRRPMDALLQSSYFKNTYIDTCLFLEQINVKDTHEKDNFFRKLPRILDQFPNNICKGKILPLLVNALDFGSATSKVLSPLLKITKCLTKEEFEEQITPHIVKWFSSNNRAMRINLIENLPTFIEYLTPKLVNSSIFPSIANGFTDQSAPLREHTVRGVRVLASKMTSAKLRDEVLPRLAKLQMDEVPSIREETTRVISDIAQYLDQPTRDKILVLAFSRALKDPYARSRLAGLRAFTKSIDMLTLKDKATRAIPSISIATIDPDVNVRKEAIATTKEILASIEKHVDNIPQAIQEEEVARQDTVTWAFNAITSKLSTTTGAKGTQSATQQTAATSQPVREPVRQESYPSPKKYDNTAPTPSYSSDRRQFSEPTKEAVQPNDYPKADDSWGDGWQDDDDDWDDADQFTEVVPEPVKERVVRPKKTASTAHTVKKPSVRDVVVEPQDTWNDDGWGEDDDWDDGFDGADYSRETKLDKSSKQF